MERSPTDALSSHMPQRAPPTRTTNKCALACASEGHREDRVESGLVECCHDGGRWREVHLDTRRRTPRIRRIHETRAPISTRTLWRDHALSENSAKDSTRCG